MNMDAGNIKSLTFSNEIYICNNCFKQKRTILNLGRAHINNMVVGSSVKSIVLDGKYDNIKLKNSKTKIGYEEGCAQIYKMTTMISKIKIEEVFSNNV